MAPDGNRPPAAAEPVSPAVLARVVAAAIASVALSGLGAELAYFYAGLPGEIASFFSLSSEANLPTWLASTLLFSCALLLVAIARTASARRDRHRWHWAALAVVFLYMSLDEAVEIHEHLAYVSPGGSGVFYFGWIFPAAGFVAVVGAAYVPFLRALPRLARRRFVVAGALYVGGALLMELPLGWWTDNYGADNLGYALIDLVEEALELAGAGTFAVALWAYHRDPAA